MPTRQLIPMKNKTAHVLTVGALVAIFVGAQGQVRPPGSQEVYRSHWRSYSTDHEVTAQEMADLMLAEENGTALPPGIAPSKDYGTIEGYVTSLVHPTNGQRCLVSIVASNSDLTAAYIFIDGVVKATATIANGKIVDIGSGLSEATMSFWLPPSLPYVVKARWENSDGTFLVEHSLTLEN